MKNRIMLTEFDNKVFIIPFIIITIVFFVIGNYGVNTFKNHYYSIKEKEALRLARSYSHHLSKSVKASDIVNQLLDGKLRVASKTVALYGENYSNHLLAELADRLEVDEIYYYNNKGEVIYSNTGEFIGWKADQGHPVFNFLNSDKTSLVEDIRQDTVNKIYYKYGYFKAADGSFVQLGIYADKIKEFLSIFEIEKILEEMRAEKDTIRICFIDNDFTVVASTEDELLGGNMTNLQAKAEIIAGREYSHIRDEAGEKLYEIFVPVKFEGNRIGALAIRYLLNDTVLIVRNVSIILLLSLFIIYAVLLYTMISQYKKNKNLFQLAYYDQLTGLPNKQYLKYLIKKELNENKVKKKAIFLVNIDNFKNINMSFGYEYGDQILKKISEKIKNLVDDNKMLFRFTADRFVLYIKDYQRKEDLIVLAEKISDLLFSQAVNVKDAKHYLSGRIGIVEIDNKYDDVDRLLKDASIVINNININDIFNYAFFNGKMEAKHHREEIIESELRRAVDEDDNTKLFLQYQPQVDLKTNKIIGFEALARMNSEHFGMVSPLEFIDIAERKKLIMPFTNLILKQAAQFMTELDGIGFKDIKIAVNISGIQLLREDFTNTVLGIIENTKMNKSNLELEITESILLENFDLINEKLKELQDHKIEIALDDFGTGYSSLSRLRELNLNTLKIDRYFISNITKREAGGLLTGDIISMAHRFGLKVVAEGVELEAEKNYLIENNCDYFQGYLFSKPLSVEDAIKLLKTNK